MERRVQTVCLLLIAAIATGAALQALQDVMIPFALAMFLSIALAPVVDGLEGRTRLSRPISVGLTMLLGILLMAVLGGVVASSIKEYNVYFTAGGDVTGQTAGPAFDVWLANKLPDALRDSALGVTAKLKGLIPSLVGVLGSALSQGITVLVFLMFLLVEQGRSDSHPSTESPGGGMGSTVRDRTRQYISVKVATSAVTGLGVGLSLWAVGAPAPMLFGLLSFLLNFIPTIGSVIAVLLPLPLLLATDAGLVTIVLALLIPGAIQFAVGQIWENKLLGDAFDLRASVVLLALVFWGKIWGIVGMLLATPITAVLKTLMEEWELTQPLARSMGQSALAGETAHPGGPPAGDAPPDETATTP